MLLSCTSESTLQYTVHYLDKKKKNTTQPATVAYKVEARSEHVHVACTLFARLDADLHAQSVLWRQKFLASELRGKFVKSALLVGQHGH